MVTREETSRGSRSTLLAVSNEEAVRLCLLAQEGDRDAEEQLLCACERLIRSVANKKWHAFGLSLDTVLTLDDFIAVAREGMWKAIQGYDPEKGKYFEPYAKECAERLILRYARNHGTAIRVPCRTHDRYALILSALDDGNLTTSEIAQATELSEEQVRTTRERSSLLSAIYLDDPTYGTTESCVADTLPASWGHPEEEVLADLFRQEVLDVLADVLFPAERSVVLHFFCFGAFGVRPTDPSPTTRSVGKEIGYSHTRVAQLLEGAMQKLKQNDRLCALAEANGFLISRELPL